MKIAFLGAGTWGFCLSNLLASKGYQVTGWTLEASAAEELNANKCHPKLPDIQAEGELRFTSDLEEALQGAQMVCEAVTTQGIRPVFEKVKEIGIPNCPIVLASKGMEQNSGLLLPEILLDVLGEEHQDQIAVLSGPGHAEEVSRKLPTSVVSSAYEETAMLQVAQTFTTSYFRVYPNRDLFGVSLGGAMKNIMAIACGICDGMGLGDGAKAALMTRGLHEIRKLSVVKGCRPETLNGLAGLGDLAVTCQSAHSRNNRFGYYLAQGLSAKEAQEKVGMVVEGVYTCRSALQLAQQADIPVPITEGVYEIVYNGRELKDIIKALMSRPVKEEQL